MAVFVGGGGKGNNVLDRGLRTLCGRSVPSTITISINLIIKVVLGIVYQSVTYALLGKSFHPRPGQATQLPYDHVR